MPSTATSQQTVNQLLRGLEVEVTPENLQIVAEVMGRKSVSKTVRVPDDPSIIDGIMRRLHEAHKPKANVADSTPQPVADVPLAAPDEKPAVKDAALPHPAYVAYRAWEDTVAFPYKQFKELASWPARENKPDNRPAKLRKKYPQETEKDTMIKYRTPDGGERVMKLSEVETRRKREKGSGLGYYLLSPEREKAGVELISEFPGAPTLETVCTISGLPLFVNQKALYIHFRDILEAILRAKVEPENIMWRERLSEVVEFEMKWVAKYPAALRELENSLALKPNLEASERQQELIALDQKWRRTGNWFLDRYYERGTRRDVLEFLRGKMNATLKHIERKVA